MGPTLPNFTWLDPLDFLGVGNFELKYLWHLESYYTSYKSYYMHFKAENLRTQKHPELLILYMYKGIKVYWVLFNISEWIKPSHDCKESIK